MDLKGFEDVKNTLYHGLVAQIPRTDCLFLLFMDTSEMGIGAVLSQQTPERERDPCSM